MKDYFGTAMTSGFPMAAINVSKIERASDRDLITIAENEHIDLSKYSKGIIKT